VGGGVKAAVVVMRMITLISSLFVSIAVATSLPYPLLPAVKKCMHALIETDNAEFSWDSRYFTGRIIRTKQEASSLISRVLTDEGARAELRGLLPEGMASLRKNPKIWNMYVRAYDRVTPFSSGYVNLIDIIHRHLPKRGVIADFGTATATIPAILMQLAPDRGLRLFDFSENALAMARIKLEFMQTEIPSRALDYRIQQIDVRKIDWSGMEPLNGVMINNLLYNLSEAEQDELMVKIAEHLAPNGVVALCELNGDIIRSGSDLVKFAEIVTMSGLDNGAPLTDFQLAYLIYLNQEILATNLPPFLTKARRQALFRHAHLREQMVYPGVYHGASVLSILTR